ncbi:transcriptional regulator [Haloferax sp. Atlit-12N]|uniref:response regulator n=1 Tax=Haloferax sp. Atlit-12N TaxID=2077203 RepID=UPI000E25695F|nr:response regulator [Haloferax sp. Atlit-12N]RDZ63163.1 transcriptional regulator [Haloferax sp. Atlit-12N]
MTGDGLPTILAVDDEPSLTTLYEAWLADDYHVRTASSAEEALELVADEPFDAAMLDRHMPGGTGDEVLSELRARDHDFPVVMVTGVEPDTDIVEMPFDDYLVKPVGKRDVRRAVRSLVVRGSYNDQLRAYFALARKRAVLEASCDRETLENSASYRELTAAVDDAEARADAARAELLEDGFEGVTPDLG